MPAYLPASTAAFATSLQRPRGSLRLKEPGKYDDRVVQHPATFSVSAFTYIQRSRRVFPVAIGLHRGKKARGGLDLGKTPRCGRARKSRPGPNFQAGPADAI